MGVPTGTTPKPSGGGGVSVHNQLTGRSAADAHPMSAVTGLADALDAGKVTRIVLVVAVDAVDGTATSFTKSIPNPTAVGGGVVPAGYEGIVTLDLAAVQGFLSYFYPDGAPFLVLSGGEAVVYELTAAGLTEPFVPAAATNAIIADDVGYAVRGQDGYEWVMARDITFNGFGIMQGMTSVGAVLGGIEGYLDNERHVRGYFMDAVDSALFSGPVADEDQPVTDDGQQIVKGDYAATLGNVAGDSDPFHWVAVVDVVSGQWGWVPSTGASTPSEAAGWTNAISTNWLTGGSKFFGRAGTVGVFMGYRDGLDHIVRGGPSHFATPETSGVWVINDPTAT